MTRSLAERPYGWGGDGSNARRNAEASGSCVPALVAAQAAVSPEALAVAGGGRGLTYAELDSRAERLARRLRALGVGPDDAVGLCLKSSPAMAVGALGIMKAGAAYLPLDPAYPRDRLAFLLSDARPPVLVTARCLVDRLPAGDWSVVALDPDGRDERGDLPPAPPVEPRPENLAYVIYTSGSTGEPKGVEITHGSLLNLVRWHWRAFDVTPSDRATQLASVGFDAAVWELWPYLTAGASVHVPDDLIRQEPEGLRDWLVRERISLTFVPTPMAERVMALPWPADCALRAMLTGADTLHHYPSPRLPFVLVNNYGPTECTVVATSATVLPRSRPGELPAIGWPIDETEIHILDEERRPVPAGVPGELYIGGAGLARGYRNRPDLTVQSFIPHPFGAWAGDRLYRTGDLVRCLPDGQLAFLGRVDEQIKIRGHRIEPAEVVAALDAHPAVRESVVVAPEATPGDKRLVAYVVLAPGARPTEGMLKEFLAGRLPDYMMPATFVALPSLPLSTNGKVDRAALPSPDATTSLRDDEVVAPRTPVEARVADLLAALLGVDRVGVFDNFFMLGGHSLLGTQLIARVDEAFAVELDLRTLFDSPTVAGLSAEIERRVVEKLESMQEEEAERLLQEPGRGATDLP